VSDDKFELLSYKLETIEYKVDSVEWNTSQISGDLYNLEQTVLSAYEMITGEPMPYYGDWYYGECYWMGDYYCCNGDCEYIDWYYGECYYWGNYYCCDGDCVYIDPYSDDCYYWGNYYCCDGDCKVIDSYYEFCSQDYYVTLAYKQVVLGEEIDDKLLDNKLECWTYWSDW